MTSFGEHFQQMFDLLAELKALDPYTEYRVDVEFNSLYGIPTLFIEFINGDYRSRHCEGNLGNVLTYLINQLKAAEKRKERMENMFYIARKPCGCVVASIHDNRDKVTAAEVAKWIKAGMTIERVTVDVVREQFQPNTGCPHVEGQLKLPLEES